MHASVIEERLDRIALAWLWCQAGKPATVAKLATAIKAMTPEGSAKELASTAIERLVQAGQAERIAPAKKGGVSSFKTTALGETRVREWLGGRELPAGRSPFGSISAYELPAMAVGLSFAQHDAKSQKALVKLLPLLVCVRQFQLAVPLDRGSEAAKLELAKAALARISNVSADRIYLKKLPGGALPALIVGTLLGEPGTAIANLDKLIAAVACRILDGCKPAQIKFAVVRRWLGQGLDSPASSPIAVNVAATDPRPTAPVDLGTFSGQAVAAAEAVARGGGPGVSSLGDKVLVYYAWRQYEQMHGPLSLERFKQNLSHANGTHVVLAREDLIPADRAAEFSQSEVRTGASSYHYIRINNLGGSYA